MLVWLWEHSGVGVSLFSFSFKKEWFLEEFIGFPLVLLGGGGSVGGGIGGSRGGWCMCGGGVVCSLGVSLFFLLLLFLCE